MDLLFKGRVVLNVSPDGLPHHGVLAHEDDGGAAETNADLLHLLRPHIIRADDEAFRIFVQVLDQAGEIIRLPGGLVLPTHLESGVGMKSLRTAI